MHVLANILVNSQLSIARLNVNSGERKGMCISKLSVENIFSTEPIVAFLDLCSCYIFLVAFVS